MTYFHRRVRWRIAAMLLLFALKLTSFVLLCVKSIALASKDAFLIQTAVQTFLSLIVMGLFVNEWTNSWPSETGQSKDMSVYGKWLYIIFMVASKVALLMAALQANIGNRLFDVEVGVYLAFEFALQVIALFIARDVFSGKTNEGFLVDVSAKKEDDEKASDTEMY